MIVRCSFPVDNFNRFEQKQVAITLHIIGCLDKEFKVRINGTKLPTRHL